MRPWIWPGGVLHVRRCGAEELKVGDIAVWFDGSRLMSHRVIAVLAQQRFVTRGDWYRRSDPPAHAHQLVGRATRFSYGRFGYDLDGPLPSALGRLPARALAKVAALVRLVRGRSGFRDGER